MNKIRSDYARLQIQIFIFVLILYGISLLFFFGYSLLAFPEKQYLLPYRGRWTFIHTFILFVRTLIPVQCAAILCTCTFIPRPSPAIGGRETGVSSTRLVSSTLLVFISLTAIFIVFQEGLIPGLEARLSRWRYQTEIARNYLELAQTAKRNKEYKQGEAYLTYYLSVDPGSSYAERELGEIRKQMGSLPDQNDSGLGERRSRSSELTVDKLIGLAKHSEQEEDYFTAYYYANLALSVARVGSEERALAGTYANSVWEKLSSYTDDSDELEKRWRFEVKTIGFNDLSSSDAAAITRAYYTFKMLADLEPSDAEARRYLLESAEKLRKVAFFTDEVEDIRIMPGIRDALFLNRRSETNQTELVSIGKIIAADSGIYVQDIEVVMFDSEGNIRCHFSALFGKVMVGPEGTPSVYMRGIDPDQPDGGMLPMMYSETGDVECPEVLPLQIDLQTTGPLVTAGKPYNELGLRGMWGRENLLAELGYRKEPIQVEMLYRVSVLFSFLVLSIASMAFGWRLKTENGLPPIITLVILPVLPFACYVITEAYLYFHRLVIGVLLLAWDFAIAGILLIALELILLVVATFLLAGPSMKADKTST